MSNGRKTGGHARRDSGSVQTGGGLAKSAAPADAMPLPVQWTDCGDHLLLYPPEPFSFGQILGYLTRSDKECLFHVENGAVTRLIPAGEEHPLIRVAEGERALRVDFPDGPAPGPDIREAAARYVWEWFDLGTDLAPFYELAGGDELLAAAAARFRGLRIVGIHDLFEALCWGIMGQQINLAFAYTLKRRFVEKFGRPKQAQGRTYWIFPQPDAIAALGIDDLKPLQLTARKSEYLIGVAGLIARGELSREKLLALGGLREIEKELTGIRGIGPWTANYVVMRCLRIPSAFPIDDAGLHNALKTMLGLGAKPSVAEIRRLSAGWENWQAYATFYLWRMLE